MAATLVRARYDMYNFCVSITYNPLQTNLFFVAYSLKRKLKNAKIPHADW